ncbi:hypothetical protein MMC25_004824 [Agyrium rufum]|nr:hypothetical protein [Agyrium rufum]
MPRAPKKNANQHNTRHENGIVAPGKRIAKQKSNGHLDGSPDGRSRANTPPLPSPAPPSTEQTGGISSVPLAKVRSPVNGDAREPQLAVGKRQGIEEGEELEGHNAARQQAFGVSEPVHRKIDVNSAKSPSVHDNGAMALTLTILKSCPLRDTLAILMVLLSLPPTVLSLTNALFALLTFVPPSGSLSTMPSLVDITLGSAGAPSLITMVMTDFIGGVLWFMLFPPIKAWTLDLTQAVVATTLGGGYANRMGDSNSTILCVVIVTLAHLTRYKDIFLRFTANTYLAEWIESWKFTQPDSLLFAEPLSSPWTFPMMAKILIALHILVQGLSRMIRRWYIRREYANSMGNKKLDAEPSPSVPQIANETSPQTDTAHSSGIAPPEGFVRNSFQQLRAIPDKISSGKRKRKQASYVRSQQPLWAAFAATKVTVIREYEHSQATKDAIGSNATDLQNLGNAPFASEACRIWITLVRPGSFFFDTSQFPANTLHEPGEPDPDGIDRTKPFYVRLNGAPWLSCLIGVSMDQDTSQSGQQFSGEVYGLSPASTYHCDFISCDDDSVLHSAVITTPSVSTVEQTTAANPSPLQDIRPTSTSPITTLKNSIAAYDASLAEATAQQRRLRKENKATNLALKKDLESLNDRVNKITAMEKNLQIRHLQQTQHMRQADDAINCISDELDSVGQIPEDTTNEWKKAKTEFEEQKGQNASFRENLTKLKSEHNRQLASLQADALSVQQKRERLQHRSAKLSDQHERLQSDSEQGLDEKERHVNETRIKQAERDQHEAQYRETVNQLARAVQEATYRGRQAWQQSQVLETAWEQQKLVSAQYPLSSTSRPITPEGDLPGTMPSTSATVTSQFRFPNFGSPDSHSYNNGSMTSPFQPVQQQLSQQQIQEANRARSYSMLSGNSVYTDFSDHDSIPPIQARTMKEDMRQHSTHSGSSGSGSPMVSTVNGNGYVWKSRSGGGSTSGSGALVSGSSPALGHTFDRGSVG